MDGCARTIEWLRGRVPVEMIREVSAADEEPDIEDHFAGIMDLMENRTWVNGAPPYCPREVLELGSWRDSDHLRRFSCCSLLVACAGYEPDDEVHFVTTSVSPIVRLTESALALGGEAPGLALEMLTWFSEKRNEPDVYPFACFCIARLRIHLGSGDPVQIKRWVEEEERIAAERLGPKRLWGSDWLVRLSIHASKGPDRAKWAWAANG